MLHSLSIQNYALIDKLNIEFSKGFTVITGETGAGKSILLGALSLLLGKRADFSVLMDDKKKSVVEGSFDVSGLDLASFYLDKDLDYDDITIVRREVLPSGKSRSFINDTPVKLDVLRDLGEQLVNIHSQYQTLELSQSNFQLKVLDDYINSTELASKYGVAYEELMGLTRKLKLLKTEHENAKRDQDYFRFQFEELQATGLEDGEDELLKNREKYLSHGEEVIQGIKKANLLFSEGDQPIIEKLAEAKEILLKIADYHQDVAELMERLESTIIEINDISSEISMLEGDTDIDPGELQQISERLDVIYRLQQKHHLNSVEELIKLREDYLARLDGISINEERINSVEQQVSKAEAKAEKLANELHLLRKNESERLASDVLKILNQLGMKDAIFNVSVLKLDNLTPSGKDKVRFEFNANKGGQAKEIAQIASGGELSRLMLAIKSLITEENLLPTVIFDEIDSGVSGEIAGKVGNILKVMSSHHQLVAISHLPQIAAKADHHLKVYKSDDNNRTLTRIKLLDEKGRVDEIAKLLSDEKVTNAAMDTARELLSFEA